MLQSIEWWASEIHRYFPEWAARPFRPGAPHESDRNSYLAGGYAEEFGHHVKTTLATQSSDPEGSEEWRIQIGALHPGYPERGTPLEPETLELFDIELNRPRAVQGGGRSHRQVADYKIIRVGRRPRTGPDGGAAAELLLLWKAFRIRRRELRRPV
jgi:hypothetical protein